MVPIRHHRRNPDQDLDRRERPRDTAFEHCTLREISISKVDRFLKSQAKVSYSRAKHAKVVLNLALGLALRYEAISRNPILGTVATVLDRAGGAELAAEMLGHTSSQITKQHYIEPDETVNSKTAKILGSLAPLKPEESI